MLHTQRILQHGERVFHASANEMQRRLGILRRVMAEQGVQALLVLDGYWEGYSQWLTGARAWRYLLVGQTGPFYAVQSEPDTWFAPLPYVCPDGVSLRVEERLEALPLRTLLSGSAPVLGFIHLEALTVELDAYLRSAVPGVQYLDITDALDPWKAEKSAEELRILQNSVRLHERAMAAVPALLRPGRTIAQVERDMRWLCQSLGSGNAEHLSLALGVRTANDAALHLREDFVPWPDHRLEYGDLVSILLETNADGGLFSALGRYFSLGPARETDLFDWDLACRVQDHAASQMKPGVNVREICDSTTAFIRALGHDTIEKNYLHSLGYCLGEKPFLLDRTETIPLHADMVYIVHPYVKFPCTPSGVQYDAMCPVDTYRVTPNGGERQNAYPRELFALL